MREAPESCLARVRVRSGGGGCYLSGGGGG